VVRIDSALGKLPDIRPLDQVTGGGAPSLLMRLVKPRVVIDGLGGDGGHPACARSTGRSEW